MTRPTDEPGLCEAARRLGLPLLALGWVRLPFIEDREGVMHPTPGGLICGREAGRPTQATFVDVEQRICQTCFQAAIDPSQRFVEPDNSPAFAETLAWMHVSNDLADLQGLVTMARISTLVRAARVPAAILDHDWLVTGGRLLRELVRSDDEYFSPALRTHPSVMQLRDEAVEALLSWRTATTTTSPTVLVLLEGVDVSTESDLVAGVLALRADLRTESASSMVVAVTDSERQLLAAHFDGTPVVQWADGDDPSFAPRTATALEGVPLERSALIADLFCAGVGGGDHCTLVQVAAALNS